MRYDKLLYHLDTKNSSNIVYKDDLKYLKTIDYIPLDKSKKFIDE